MEKPTTLHLLTNPVEAYDEYLLIKPKGNFDLFNHEKTSNAIRMLERTLELLHTALRDLGKKEAIYGMTRKELEDQVNRVYAEKLDLEQYVDAEMTAVAVSPPLVKGKLPLVDSDDDPWIGSDWKPRGCISSIWDLETSVPMKTLVDKLPKFDESMTLKELVRGQPRLWYELEASVACRDYHRMFLDFSSKGICANLYLYNGRRNICCTMSVQPSLRRVDDEESVVVVTLRQYVKSCCADGITIVELYRYLGMTEPAYRMTLKSYDGRVFAHITSGTSVVQILQAYP